MKQFVRRVVVRLRLLLMGPFILLDCFANWVIGGSFSNTLSSEAWNHREHPEWGWTWQFIDTLFGVGHCKRVAELETKNGGAWGAWAVSWRTA